MGDRPDDVPSLEELGSDDELPEYWTESTTITVDRWVKQSLDRHRDGRPWNQYLEKLRREHADPITLNDAEEIAERVSDNIARGDVAIDADNVADAIREELDTDAPDFDEIKSALETVEERTGRIERTLEDVEGRMR